ncbi:Ribosome-binding ATPase YchF [Bienertia sinuspersici]
MIEVPRRTRFLNFYGQCQLCQNGNFSYGRCLIKVYLCLRPSLSVKFQLSTSIHYVVGTQKPINIFFVFVQLFKGFEPSILSSSNISTAFFILIKEYLLLFFEQDGYNGLCLPKFVAILWAIWVSKNNPIFHNDQPTLPSILHRIEDNITNHTVYTDFLGIVTSHTPTKPLDKPPRFLLAHIGQQKDNMSSAWVLADSPARGGAFFSKAASDFQAEALALLNGLIWARNIGFNDFIVYIDSSPLIMALQQRTTSKDSTWVIKDLLQLGLLFNTCKVLKVHRLQIQPAHDRANECRSSFLCFQSFKSLLVARCKKKRSMTSRQNDNV